VEGVYLLRQRLRHYWDLSVFVDAPRGLRRARAYSRGESEEGWLAQWLRAEDYYERVEDPAAAADLVVAGY
jgi:uridine kinase